MTFGFSRDDVGKFLPIYLSKGILQSDPFEVSQQNYTISNSKKISPLLDNNNQMLCQVLDQKGVGQLIKIATEKGRGARPSLKASNCISVAGIILYMLSEFHG